MVRKSIGVDFLGYNDAENLADAVGMPKDSMCFTCSSGNYDSLGIKPDFTKREQVKAKIQFDNKVLGNLNYKLSTND